MKTKFVVIAGSKGQPKLFHVAETRATAKDLGKVSPHMARRIARGEKIQRLTIRQVPVSPEKPSK
jgi:hypothetical protein